MARYLLDCETNGLLDQLDRVHCLVLRDIDTGDIHSFKPDEVEKGVRLLADADLMVAHNAIGFDVPALNKVYPWFNPDRSKVLDTVLISRLIWTDMFERDLVYSKKHPDFPKQLRGRHSLESWGHRLGEYKGDYSGGWAEWSQEMHDYCEQDVEVLWKLWLHIEKQHYSQEAIELEHQVQWIVFDQERHGFMFDVQSAAKLLVVLKERHDELDAQLRSVFKPWFIGKEVKTPKKTIRYKDKTRGDLTEGAPYQKVELTTFNPGSRHHIASRLKHLYGWKPKEYTNSGEPKIDETVLGKLKYPEAKLIAEYLMVQKRLGQLAEGNNAWLKLEKNGRIHGRVNINGAATGRMTHNSPNVTQVPSTRKPYGKECRSLFCAHPGRVIVGADVAGLELRMLAHYLARYDGGEYGKIVLESDVHTHNQHAAGLTTRDQAKTFIYAYTYGAGDSKLGEIVDAKASIAKRRNIGKRLRVKFEKEIPALGRLTKAVKSAFGERGYLIGLDGRRLLVRSEHSALNMLLQGGGAIVCKRWMVEADRLLAERGLKGRCQQVATVHDELQFEADQDIAEEVGKALLDGITAAGEGFGLRMPLDGEFKIGKTWADTH